MQSETKVSDGRFKERVIDFGERKWESLSDSQKNLLKRSWGVLTYKWQWQIALNAPIMILWVLDRTVPSIHRFDMAILASLPLPDWINSMMSLN